METHNYSKIKDKVQELIKYNDPSDLLVRFNESKIPKFPVNGLLLAAAGVKKGPDFTLILNHMRQLWKESNFTLSRDQLMGEIDQIIAALTNKKLSILKSNDFVLPKKRKRQNTTK
ncbi:hypothetical protein GJ496_007506 [Pomphorhynchus laevis]|nr:hypothetical protein GJ496_007506 [Pomphorhynchus laevis]